MSDYFEIEEELRNRANNDYDRFATSWYCPNCEDFVFANGDRRCNSCGHQVTTLSTIQGEIARAKVRWRINEEEDMAVPRGNSYAGVDYRNLGDEKAPYPLRWEYMKDDDNVDNWKHRSANMKCNTCMFYVPKALSDEANHAPTVGRCRRHAPSMTGFPVVYVDDWCGDHKLDEEKI